MIRAIRSSALSLLLALAVNGVLAHGQDPAPAPPAAQPVTLAQIFVTGDLGQNLERIRAAFAQAEREKAQWVFFPEGRSAATTTASSRRKWPLPLRR